MVHFDNKAFPTDYLYMKFRDSNHAVNLPLCEVLSGIIVKKELAPNQVVIYSDMLAEEGEDPKIVVSREELKKQLEYLFVDLGPIEGYALQPEGEFLNTEVYEFLEKYNQ